MALARSSKAPAQIGMWKSTWAIVQKEWRIERRSGEVLSSTVLFAILVVVLTSLSFYVDPNSARNMAPGVLWMTVAFSGVLATGRTWAREREYGALRGLMLSPMPRVAIYLGKMLASFALIMVV